MNPEAQAELNRILSLDPNDATESDMAFLRARRTYLTEEQRIKFGVSEATTKSGPAEAEPQVDSEVASSPKARSKSAK